MESLATIKYSSSLQAIPQQLVSGALPRPDSYDLTFTAKARIGYQVRTLPVSGIMTLTLADEGITASALVKLECLTAGQHLTVAIDNSLTPLNINAVDATSRAFFEASLNCTKIVITNSNATAIDIGFAIFEKNA